MRQIFTLILSISLLASCTPSKNVKQTKIIKKVIRDTVYLEKIKAGNENKYVSAVLDDYKINDSHFPAIGQDYRQKFLILHYTALDNYRSYNVLTEQQVSSHYLINDIDDNTIDILVSESQRAWHAGYSYWLGRTNINDSSIGIEIVNPGYRIEDEQIIFFPYPEYQFKKVAKLSKNIVERYDIDPTYVLGHSDVAPQRKEDPGALFPWKRLYDEYGVGAWYEDVDKYEYIRQFPYERKDSEAFILAYQKEFAKYGYEVPQDGIWSKKMEKLTAAFQMHFRPSNYSGELDAETWAILRALNKKYRD
ncbi:N-acetylmuramoyl-L-alanine amidase [Flavobacteriaceae bacterium Ap0902]|nr:N-acetylmuramoyl-L-alanine amidase [Flavobacteriaceae bacterium Ap0902]